MKKSKTSLAAENVCLAGAGDEKPVINNTRYNFVFAILSAIFALAVYRSYQYCHAG